MENKIKRINASREIAMISDEEIEAIEITFKPQGNMAAPIVCGYEKHGNTLIRALHLMDFEFEESENENFMGTIWYKNGSWAIKDHRTKFKWLLCERPPIDF